MTNNFGNNITELRRLFDDMLEENRLVLRRKRDEASEGAYNVSSLRRIIDVILDEVGYLKTEQTFDRLHAIGNGPMATPPYLGAIHSKSERSPYAAPRAVEIDSMRLLLRAELAPGGVGRAELSRIPLDRRRYRLD